MFSSLTVPRRPRPQWLLGAVLILLTGFACGTLPAQNAPPGEVSALDVAPTFKLQSERNVVMVRVAVRDGKGAVVENLHKEDFQLFDHGKLQTISHFSMEKPAPIPPAAAPQKSPESGTAEPEEADETATPVTAARRFVAIYFDDVNTVYEDLTRARAAADHFLTSSARAGDRFALYTSSGLTELDFTDNLAQMRQALLGLRPHPVTDDRRTCGVIPPYEAYLIVNNHDNMAIAVAAEEILNCDYNSDPTYSSEAQNRVEGEAMRALNQSEVQSTAALRGIESIIRRLTALPGQRSMVIVSGGFLTDTLRFQLSEIADRALRGGVILNAIDARGLYTDTTLDATQSNFAVTSDQSLQGTKHQFLMESARQQTDGMRSLAVDTGGVFFNNSNDLEAGFRKAAALPEAFYLLAFSPQNLKLDGAFHPLQVKLVSAKGLAVQARRGYYAPKKLTDPTAQEKEEIQEAVFSRDETHELTVDVHTQYFMKTETDARIAVVTRMDLHQLHFRKAEDRNLDNLTFVTVLFDQDGHVVMGRQKSLEMRLRDVSLQKFLQTGITLRTVFDVKPGTYLVRAIVRDSESGQLSSLNRTVEIPY